MADEKAFLIVVRIHKPAGNSIGVVAPDFASIGMEHVHAVDSDLCPVVGGQ